MGNIFNRPIVGVVMCRECIEGHYTQTVEEKYLDAVFAAGGLPVALPQVLASQPYALDSVIARLDGIFLTGSPSNIEPHHYGEEGIEEWIDPGRDKLALTLIRSVLDQRLPLFAACRGMQELVVATGGALHRQVHNEPGFMDHREDLSQSADIQYGPAHPVIVEPGGLLESLLPGTPLFEVNSLHGQGTRRLSPSLRVEASAPDGLVEAVSVRDHPFALGVQWHPEWRIEENPVSRQLFEAFICACRDAMVEERAVQENVL
ncbi:gamma-glutamyl-gamma-aminobutyrate hydrolase [Chimaeribacter arupi]|uniref:gamma-glutamyl-gamma-aminobutyrate hydrolase n=2 Tax=Yersiniaceae TaxID=1903411 RepID=A0A2N5EJE7_9GAMM|nr:MULTISPECIES: gamma-glutamyl-gamma-aminobutyrate hydrolase [Yersiniaceae]MBS0967755.1 gamma-glutamyl-gamma-aminobutyrate hydrolase [Nissabacter archeti]MDV5140804.1 gamma-glutamyl-gamma-aminobutyrate hydrolase [Chimaeribacter arupi]PLR39047.1 gamma-glutamyl-gamma-aminobutyrate hydrolase [Chimaeribacter arupi]PLR43947.1 gamma-glutamyl-gamma-aminobutyrate hydrolase [Chimaeribacter arupi]PLR45692.1 gamma-glutamyl-gamma-aminobutyrate hydrolase [Chimaeribacter arupi]